MFESSQALSVRNLTNACENTGGISHRTHPTVVMTTVGGMLGVDGAGPHAVRVGSARDHTESIECVLSGGQRLELGRETLVKHETLHQMRFLAE